jgi:hypothetical protein
MKKESNLIFYLRFRELGVEHIYFADYIVVLTRPTLEV